MGNVRTKTLAADTAGGGSTTIYTVPAGETAIVKTIASNKAAAGAVVMDLIVRRAGVSRTVFRRTYPVVATVAYDELWLVLMPGDELRATTDTGSVTLWVSGTELEGVAD